MERVTIQDGKVIISLGDYEFFQTIYSRWLKSLTVADNLKDIIEGLSVSGYEMDRQQLIEVSKDIKYCEEVLREY